MVEQFTGLQVAFVSGRSTYFWCEKGLTSVRIVQFIRQSLGVGKQHLRPLSAGAESLAQSLEHLALAGAFGAHQSGLESAFRLDALLVDGGLADLPFLSVFVQVFEFCVLR